MLPVQRVHHQCLLPVQRVHQQRMLPIEGAPAEAASYTEGAPAEAASYTEGAPAEAASYTEGAPAEAASYTEGAPAEAASYTEGAPAEAASYTEGAPAEAASYTEGASLEAASSSEAAPAEAQHTAMAHKLVLILGALEGVLSQETQKRELHANPCIHVNLPYARTLLSGTKIQVYQIPEVHATLGSDVTLPCTYNVSGVEEATIGSYKWYRHLVKTELEVSDSNENFTGRISRADTEQFISNRDAHITIHNVVISDTASYFCAVSFLEGGGISGCGAGTLLNVTDRIQNEPRGPELLQQNETSQYMMENQQYNLFLPVQAPQKPGPSIYQEADLYSVIP
ncbi:uncharacterized protein LOC120979092 [Bufo bufo]|uniref:uncharacterized protein LOC120979092 n=1 Tax=Bufo bufo TaxID=8384 RepID=UPI001ABE86F2|nr:uncharacterized protein LOC120979092 [Bufo bufo]